MLGIKKLLFLMKQQGHRADGVPSVGNVGPIWTGYGHIPHTHLTDIEEINYPITHQWLSR